MTTKGTLHQLVEELPAFELVAAGRDLRGIDPQVREWIRQAVYRFANTSQRNVQRLRGRPQERAATCSGTPATRARATASR
jgi:hypothetical protein